MAAKRSKAKLTKAERLKQQRLLVIARLGGPSWWRKDDMPNTYWHW